jgi:hypothetical protein
MPIHDWTLVPTGIFDAFHHAWVQTICNSLNRGILPHEYYALPEQPAAEFGPDILCLQTRCTEDDFDQKPGGTATALLTRPQTRFTAETDAEFCRRKKSSVVVQHVSGGRIIAMIEVVSPGNKAGQHALRVFLDKAYELLEARIHLLIIDPFPPGPGDPNGLHAAIWAEIQDNRFQLPNDKPLTLVAYECGLTTRAYIEPIAVGDVLPDMPLFLEPDGYVKVPLEATYQAAFAVQPQRWWNVLQPPQPGDL